MAQVLSGATVLALRRSWPLSFDFVQRREQQLALGSGKPFRTDQPASGLTLASFSTC